VQKRFRLLGSRLVLPFQLVLRKTAERSSRKKEWQRIGDEIDTAMILAGANFKRASGADTIKVSRTSPAEFRMKFLNEQFVPAQGSTTWQQ
jgi:hypothetical protein